MKITWQIILYIEFLWELIGCTFLIQACPNECMCLSHTQVLCNTGGLTEIPLKFFPIAVEQLSLTKNHFPIIKSDAFNGLRALRKLSLDGNNITTIKPFAFRGLPRLRELSIQYTPLQTVAKFAFAGLPNITHINLAHNKIIKIEEYAFTGTANVYEIILENNPMLTIKTNAFSGLTNVGRLLLPSGIRNIERDAFNGLNGVGLLRLSFMDLVALHQYTFRGLTNVHVLSLQESDLGVICAGAFDGLTNVDNLRIINNKIDAIEELNLTHENVIKEFRLHGNHLLETPEPGTITLTGIKSLSVIDNHFPCGCHIHTLLDSPLANGTYQHEDFLLKNFCISPLEVNGRRINEIDIFSIGRCHEHVTRENLEASSALSTLTSIEIFNLKTFTTPTLGFRRNFCLLLFVGLVIYAYCIKNEIKFS